MKPRLSLSRVRSLSPTARYRYVRDLLTGGATATPDAYLRRIVDDLAADTRRPPQVCLAAGDLGTAWRLAEEVGSGGLPVARRRAALLEALAREAGIDPVDGEWRGAGGEARSATDGRRETPSPVSPPAALPVVVWLPHIRAPFNVGNIVRTAATYGVAGVVLGEAAPAVDHPRLARAAMGGARLVPVVRGGVSEACDLLAASGAITSPAIKPPAITPPAAPSDAAAIQIVLETGGTPVNRFAFPPAGILVAGHEELGVPEEILEPARRSGRVVSIPHDGPKTSLNVGVAVGICLSWWYAATG